MPLNLVIDMRCLQDGGHAERGIPAHAGAMIRLARDRPALRAARITGIIDPGLSPLPPEIAAVADELRPNGYLPELPPGSLFLNPAPMGPDQEVLGRLLLSPGVVTAAIVYDFIPLDQPAHYLAAPETRLGYATAMAWLRRYGLFLPVSAATRTRLQALLPGAAGVVTGVSLSLFSDGAAAPAPPRHLLMAGGDDPRKNPETAIRAHAGSAKLQDGRIPLIITGFYPPARLAELRGIAAAAGGDPALLRLPGRLPAAALKAAYARAYCVVTPSRAEGFSLPVVEAMAAGVPSFASGIPAHAELATDPDWRFAPDDPPALAALCEAVVADPARRAGITAAQARIWPAFRPAAVADRLWSAVAAMAPPAAPAVIGRRPRIALISPLPPAQSGVADFSARLAAALARRAEVTLVSPSPAAGAAPLSGLPHLSPRHDRVVSTLGNSAHYHRIYDLLRRYGGACICHDARLLGFALTRFGPAGAAAMATRELGRTVGAEEVQAWGRDESTREANLLGEVAAAARPLIFHDRHTVAEVNARFGTASVQLPFAVYRPWAERPGAAGQAAARERLGLAAGETVIASFGFAEAFKGVAPALRALALLRDAGHACRLLWVGRTGAELERFAALAAGLGVAGLVRFGTEFLSEAVYRDHLLAADFGLQLRIGRRGNVSGALQDCIAAGLPTVANDDLAENLQAPGYVRRVGDGLEPAEISAAFMGLMGEARPRADFAEEARAYCAAHSMEVYAERLCGLLGL